MRIRQLCSQYEDFVKYGTILSSCSRNADNLEALKNIKVKDS